MNSKLSSTDKKKRREVIAGIGALFAGACSVPMARAIQPIKRDSQSPLKLGLAAYSMNRYLPNTRNDPKAVGEIDIFGFVKYASSLGIDGVELTSYFLPHPLSRKVINELKRETHLQGLEISGGAIGNNFTHAPSSEEGLAQMRYTRGWVDHYAMLGARVVRVFGGKPVGDISESKAVENILANMRIACDYAAEKGVILAIENHDFLTDIDRLLPIVDAIDSPWFGVNFDSANIALTEDPYRELARIAPYAVNAQIKASIPILGEKEKVASDLPRIVDILKDANYRGYVTLEYEDKEDPYEQIPKYLSTLRALI